jgi:peptide deformylase
MKVIKPHKKVSRDVTEDDLKFVAQEAKEMEKLCNKETGRYPGGLAIAHCQVNEDDPLRFFVTRAGGIVVNPIIMARQKYPTMSSEGCLSYPDTAEVQVPRAKQVTVRFYNLVNGEMLKRENTISGLNAYIFQHELDHFDGKYVFDYSA